MQEFFLRVKVIAKVGFYSLPKIMGRTSRFINDETTLCRNPKLFWLQSVTYEEFLCRRRSIDFLPLIAFPAVGPAVIFRKRCMKTSLAGGVSYVANQEMDAGRLITTKLCCCLVSLLFFWILLLCQAPIGGTQHHSS